MASNYMPQGMRPARLEERKEFYLHEFSVPKVSGWFEGKVGKTKFAVIIGKHTRIFPQVYGEDAETTIVIDEYENLEDVRSQIMEFEPESVYYDRVVYDEQDRVVGQELVFDLDPENIACPIHGSLADKMNRRQGLSFCELELNMVKDQTVRLYEYLEKQFCELSIVYSGRGFHIHVFDSDAFLLSKKKRSALAASVKAKGFGIDEWVTSGEMHLIRLPYSLHGLVSRIVLPLEKKEVLAFDPVVDARCIPAFLRI